MKRAFSCFIDVDPILRSQAFIWVNCLTRVQDILPSAIFVHMPPGSSDFRDWLEEVGVQIVETGPFDARNRYCNKLQQLTTFLDGKFEQVVFMDCDTAWIGDQQIPVGAPIAAKIVDLANPSETVLSSIFAASGLGEPDWLPVSFPADENRSRSDWNNCNGGLYICQGGFLPQLAPRWKYWARWCLDHGELFGKQNTHADQVSFALAMKELGAKVTHLDLSWNYPLHLKGRYGIPDVSPNILHYHREFTPHMTLLPVGLQQVDDAITSLNERIENFNRERLVNSMFWDFRYVTAPELGSGVGSRGDNLDHKRALLAGQLNDLADVEVVDVGCGDLEVTRHLSISRYTGLDVSEAALRIAREKRPDWTFEHVREASYIPSSEIVICLDVLIHQPDEAAFNGLVQRLTSATGSTLLVSGYEAPPEFNSQLTRFYKPLSEALRSTGKFSDIRVVGIYRDTVLLRAEKLAKPGNAPASMDKQ